MTREVYCLAGCQTPSVIVGSVCIWLLQKVALGIPDKCDTIKANKIGKERTRFTPSTYRYQDKEGYDGADDSLGAHSSRAKGTGN